MQSTATRSGSLAELELTLSGVIKIGAADSNRIPLTSAMQLCLQVVRMVRDSHDRGEVVGVLDAAHLLCSPNGVLQFKNTGSNPTAPELKRGDMPDRLTDVYALGALMYRLLTGRRVEPSRIIEPPSHFNPAVIETLDQLVLSALEDDPSDRPYSAREMEEGLLAVFEDLGLESSSRTDVTHLIRKSVNIAPKKRIAPPRIEVEEDDDDAPPVRRSLETKWAIAAGAAALVLIAMLLAWPSQKKAAAPPLDDTPPVAKVTAAVPQGKLAQSAPTVKKVVFKKGTHRSRR